MTTQRLRDLRHDEALVGGTLSKVKRRIAVAMNELVEGMPAETVKAVVLRALNDADPMSWPKQPEPADQQALYEFLRQTFFHELFQ